MPPDLTEEIEKLIDRFGLAAVTESIAVTAALRGTHLESTGEHRLAEGWRRASTRFSDLAFYLRRWPEFTK